METTNDLAGVPLQSVPASGIRAPALFKLRLSHISLLSLIKPNATRWNSIFMAVQPINQIIKEKGESVIHSVCSLAEVPKYSIYNCN